MTSTSGTERLSLIERVLLGVIGTVFTVAGAAVVSLLVFLCVRDASLRRNLARDPFLVSPVVFLIALLFVAITAYGVKLVQRAVRGHSQRHFVRAQAWYLRHWYVITLLGSGLLAGVGMALAGGPTAFLMSRGAALLHIYWFAFVSCLVLPFHVAIHELGHAAMGVLVRFRFATLRVGWLVIHRESGRFQASWSATGTLNLLGLHRAIPEGEEALGARFALFCAGGPIATLVLAAICRLGCVALEPARTLSQATAVEVLSVGWWMGIYLGVFNLLPIRFNSGLMTDGAHVLNALLFRSPAAKVALRFGLLWQQGRRPREWGMSVESILTAANEDRRCREALLLAALGVALDTGDRARQNEVLRLVQEMGPPRNAMMHFEFELQSAMVEAFGGNVRLARERINRLGSHPTVPHYPRLAEAVILLCEGRPNEARTALDEWQQALAKSGMASALRVGNEWAEEALLAKLTPRELAQLCKTGSRAG